jgi:hypothetical protein
MWVRGRIEKGPSNAPIKRSIYSMAGLLLAVLNANPNGTGLIHVRMSHPQKEEGP